MLALLLASALALLLSGREIAQTHPPRSIARPERWRGREVPTWPRTPCTSGCGPGCGLTTRRLRSRPFGRSRLMCAAPTAGRPTMRGVAGDASELDRKGFIADPTVSSELGVGVDDLRDRDVRTVVIRSEHPEFEEALTSGRREIDLG